MLFLKGREKGKGINTGSEERTFSGCCFPSPSPKLKFAERREDNPTLSPWGKPSWLTRCPSCTVKVTAAQCLQTKAWDVARSTTQGPCSDQSAAWVHPSHAFPLGAGSSSSTVPHAHHHQCPSVALCIPGRIHSCLCLRAVPSSSGFCLEFLCIPFPSSSVACPGGQDPSWSPGHGAQPLSISAIHVLRAPHPCRCLVCSAVPLHQ